jgi:exodeoxyribonuclease VII large subunit
LLTRWSADIATVRERGRRATLACIGEAVTEVAGLGARITAMSPQGTLDRGYAILQRADGSAVRDPAEVVIGERLSGRVAAGEVPLQVIAS